MHDPEHLLEGLRRYPAVIEYIMAPASFYAPLLIREDRAIFPAVEKNPIGIIAMKAMGAADQEGGYIFKLKPRGRAFEELAQKGLSIGKCIPHRGDRLYRALCVRTAGAGEI